MSEAQPAASAVGPIGVFDSGVGGLTVVRALRAAVPAEDLIYLGDTARLPYGTKTPETVIRYSLQCARGLVERGIRCLVVACNTASAHALPALRDRYPDLPVYDVIEPGAAAAVNATTRGHIAVIATQATIDSGAYERAIRTRAPGMRVTSRACALFVALAEEGWHEGPIAVGVAQRYLERLFAAADAPDTLVLGCTHFPLLRAAIGACVPPGVRIVDSAATTAEWVRTTLPRRAPVAAGARLRWLATDGARRFASVGARFLGEPIGVAQVEIVDL